MARKRLDEHVGPTEIIGGASLPVDKRTSPLTCDFACIEDAEQALRDMGFSDDPSTDHVWSTSDGLITAVIKQRFSSPHPFYIMLLA